MNTIVQLKRQLGREDVNVTPALVPRCTSRGLCRESAWNLQQSMRCHARTKISARSSKLPS